jgi:hypothetical protein
MCEKYEEDIGFEKVALNLKKLNKIISNYFFHYNTSFLK